MRQISASDLAAWLADASRDPPLLLDVREPWEYEKARIAGAQLVPMREVPARLSEIDQRSRRPQGVELFNQFVQPAGERRHAAILRRVLRVGKR